MKVLAYLAFTLLSIAIQFCVMDLIGRDVAIEDEKRMNLNISSHKKRLNDVLKEFINKPHALYYRNQRLSKLKNNNSDIKISYNNVTIPDIPLEISTDLSTTILDLIYDDNVTETKETFTTEEPYTTTEYENFTEISLFGQNNETIIKKFDQPKRKVKKDCSCNLLYKVCDINCCCDSDCNDAELQMFVNCIKDTSKDAINEQFCYSHHSLYGVQDGSDADNLFCFAKSNLPEKRKIHNSEMNAGKFEVSFKWRDTRKAKPVDNFNKKKYRYKDPLWMLKNGSIYYVDLPMSLSSNYCAARKPIRFLKEEKLKCNVKISDLEIFNILNVAETKIISVNEKSLNSTNLNCSTLHCTNWTVNICEEEECMEYNKSLHEALCNENTCTNLALKIDYIFNYYDNKITNATIKLYAQKLYLNVPLLEQEVNVYFLLANKSVEKIIEFSENPGYISGLPVIVSYAESNHTDNFHNNTMGTKKYLLVPVNENGVCITSHFKTSFVLFGINKRMKCRYNYIHNASSQINSDTCKTIQNNLNKMFGIQRKVTVSPFGNPQDLTDEDWVSLQQTTLESTLYGEMKHQNSVLRCFNLINSLSLTIVYVDVGEGNKRENKITSVKAEVSAHNVSYNVEDVSTVITIDIVFVDKTIPKIYEFAGGPHLNIYLPSDFFFPFPSNRGYYFKSNIHVIFYSCILYFIK